MPDTRSEIEAAFAAAESSEGSQPSSTTATSTASSSTASSATQSTGTAQTSDHRDPDDESTLPQVGAIPVERVRAILQNARKKAAAETEGRYAWAKDVQPEQYAQHREILNWLDNDPVAFYKFLDSQLKAHPTYAQALQPARPAAQADPEPKPDLQLADGTFTYSRDQFNKLFEWRERQLEQRVTQKFAPLQDAFDKQARLSSGMAKAQAAIDEARTWQGFNENIKDIYSLMKADKRVTLESAYRRVVVPKLAQSDKDKRESLRQEILQELKSKPAANTETPGRVTNAAPASYKGKSTEEIMRMVMSEL